MRIRRLIPIIFMALMIAPAFLSLAPAGEQPVSAHTSWNWTPAANTWVWNRNTTGNWNVASNWYNSNHTGTVPTDHAIVVFNGSGVGNCYFNRDALLTSISFNAGYTGVFNNSASCDVTTTGDITISAGTVTSVTTAVWTCGGNFVKTGGTISNDVLRLTFTNLNAILTAGTDQFYALIFNDASSITFGSAWILTSQLTVASGKTITINTAGKIFGVTSKATTTFLYSNLGAIAGAASLYIDAYQNTAVSFGTVNCPVVVELNAAAPASATVSLGASTTLGSTLKVDSAHASRTMTLSHGSNYLLQVAGLTTLGARGVMTQGTGAWSFNGGLTINGASARLNQGGTIYINGTTTNTLGILAGDSTNWIIASGSWAGTTGTKLPDTVKLKMTGSGKTLATGTLAFHDLWLAAGSSTTLGSDVQTNHTFVMDGSLSLAGYSLVCTGTIAASVPFTSSTAGVIEAGTSMTASDNWDTSTFTFNRGTATISLTGAAKTIKTKAGWSFYFLDVDGQYSMISDMNVTNNLVVSGNLSASGDEVITTNYTEVYGNLTQGTGAWNLGTLMFNDGSFIQNANVTTYSMTHAGGILQPNVSYYWTMNGDLIDSGGWTPNLEFNIIWASSGTFYQNYASGNSSENAWLAQRWIINSGVTLSYQSGGNILYYGGGAINLSIQPGGVLRVLSGTADYPTTFYPGFPGYNYSNLGTIEAGIGMNSIRTMSFWGHDGTAESPGWTNKNESIFLGNITCPITFHNDAPTYWRLNSNGAQPLGAIHLEGLTTVGFYQGNYDMFVSGDFEFVNTVNFYAAAGYELNITGNFINVMRGDFYQGGPLSAHDFRAVSGDQYFSGEPIYITGSWIYTGHIVPLMNFSDSVVYLKGSGETIKTHYTQHFHDVWVSGAYRLLSDIYIDGWLNYTATGSIDLNGYTIYVNPLNITLGLPPSFTSTPELSAYTYWPYQYYITANQLVTITLWNTTAGWLSITNGTLTGTPVDTDVGFYTVSIMITSSGGSTWQNFTLTVYSRGLTPANVYQYNLIFSLAMGFGLIGLAVVLRTKALIMLSGIVWIYCGMTIFVLFSEFFMIAGIGTGMILFIYGGMTFNEDDTEK